MDLSGDHNQLVPSERPGLVKKRQLECMARRLMHDACKQGPIQHSAESWQQSLEIITEIQELAVSGEEDGVCASN